MHLLGMIIICGASFVTVPVRGVRCIGIMMPCATYMYLLLSP